jgi:hypothetical protein
MQVQKRIRLQMLLLGLGAALLVVAPARAQQDMDPTCFDINPGTPAVSKASAVRTAHKVAIKETAEREDALAIASGKDATMEAGVIRVEVVDAGVVLILLSGIGAIVLYAMASTRHERYAPGPRSNGSYASISGATAR